MSQANSQSVRESGASDAASPQTAAANGGPRGRSGLLVGAAMVATLIAVAIVGLQWFLPQRIPAMTEADVKKAEELWDSRGPAGYDMEIDIRGAQPGDVHIQVRNHQVTTMTRDGITPPERTWDVWSVPGLFETLERELQLAEDPVHEMDVAAGTQVRLRCEFNREFGYPQVYHRHVTGGGPEVYWRIKNFVVK